MLNEQYELHHELWPTLKTKFSLTQSRREAELRRENIFKNSANLCAFASLRFKIYIYLARNSYLSLNRA